MHRIRTILVATAFAVGLAGVAGATERVDGYDGYQDDRGGTYGHGDYGRDGYGRDYGRLSVRGHVGYRDGDGRVGVRHGRPGYGRITPGERLRIQQARLHLRLLQRRAMRDGIVTRWERVRIHQARQRLAWLTLRLSHNGAGW